MAVDDAYTVSLLHFDGGITDESGKVWTAQSGATVSANQSKFGGSSLYLNGSCINIPANSITFDTIDFTIDYWEYRATHNNQPAFANGTRAAPSIMMGYGANGCYVSSNLSTWDIANAKTMGSYIYNVWTHYALVRQGNNFYVFQNGVLQSTWTSSAAIAVPTTTPMYIGGFPLNYFSGYVDEFRISKIARWTSNFTPPTAPYSSGVSVNPPTNLTAIAGDSQITLSWDAVTGATGYNVKRSTTAGGPYTTIATNVTGTSYLDTTVTNGTTYYYVITAVDSSGNESANSNEAFSTPVAAQAPTGQALLRVTMIDSSEREYQLSASEIDGFINWYTRTIGTGTTCYVLNKKIGMQNSKEYLAFDKIISFEVMELTK